MTITTEKLKEMVGVILHTAVSQLKNDGGLSQQFFILTHPDMDMEILSPVGEANDDALKSFVAQTVRERVKRGDVAAVIHVTDAWIAEPKDQAASDMIRRFQMGARVANAAGLANLREMVMVYAETPTSVYTLRQYYRRPDGPDTPRIELEGGLVEEPGMRYEGRFANLWPVSARPN